MTPDLPQTLAANPRLSTWLTAHPDGTFDLRVGKVELGQGVVTALAQIAAQELGVAPARVRPIATNTAVSPDEGLTAGSMSIMVSGASVRRVCAEVRCLFARAAASRLGVDESAVTVGDGSFRAPDGTVLGYADLAKDVDLDVDAGDSTLEVSFLPNDPGMSGARVDLPDKVFGRRRFIHDLTFEDMLHARVVRPPRPGAHLLEAPVDDVTAMPGVTRVVREHDFLAVLADRESLAVKAAGILADQSSWSAGTTLPDQSALSGWLRTQEAETTTVRDDGPRPEGGTDGPSDLREAVRRTRIDRSGLRDRRLRRPAARRVDPQPGRLPAPRRDRGGTRAGRERRRGAARRGGRGLRAQLRGRRSLRRRSPRDTRSGLTRPRSVEPRRRALLGAVRAGHGGRRHRDPGSRRTRRGLVVRAVEQRAHRPAGLRTGARPARRRPSGRRRRPSACSRPAGGPRSRIGAQRRALLRVLADGRDGAPPPHHADQVVGAALSRRALQRLRDRVGDGRAGRSGRS